MPFLDRLRQSRAQALARSADPWLIRLERVRGKVAIVFYWSTSCAVCRDSMPELFRDRGVVERPKVLYNARTRQYVMWMHLDANRYQEAMAGVAVAQSAAGPVDGTSSCRPLGSARNRLIAMTGGTSAVAFTVTEIDLIVDSVGSRSTTSHDNAIVMHDAA